MKAKDVRKGTVLLHNNQPFKVIDFHHNTPGKGRATVWIKMRNMKTGNQTEITSGSVEDVDVADVYTFKATYLYNDGDEYNFLAIDSHEQVSMTAETLGDTRFFLQDELNVEITTFNEEAIGINIPSTVIMEVVETEPEIKGATVTSSGKPAKVTSGYVVTVPGFVKEGDRIIINTEEGKYISRAE